MRVEDKINIAYEKVNTAAKKDNAEAKNQASKAVSESDKLVLSSEAKKVAELKDAVKSSPEIRQDRVSEIREQIKSNTYNVSGEKVAEKVVNAAIDDLF